MVIVVYTHCLAGYCIREHLIRLNLDSSPILIASNEINTVDETEDDESIVLLDLFGLPMPVSFYVQRLCRPGRRPIFLALDKARSPRDIAHLLLLGFSGFLTHEEIPSTLSTAVATVNSGQVWVSPEVMRVYVQLTSTKIANGFEVLTRREMQIMELLKHRYTNREIAEILDVSESTVKFHVSNLMSKLGVSGRRSAPFSDSKPRHTSASGFRYSGSTENSAPKQARSTQRKEPPQRT